MQASSRGKFITLEGGEGVGKSTQLHNIESALRDAGIQVCVTREPGGTPRAEQIRQLLLARDEEALPDVAELLLMFAARATHLKNRIEPALARGEWVLCDRFTDATYAYQGHGRGMSLAQIADLESWVQQGLQPDLTLLLDAPVAIGMARAAQRSAENQVAPDRFEIEQHDFFERVRRGYHARAAAQANRFRVIDATQPLAVVSAEVGRVIQTFVRESLRP